MQLGDDNLSDYISQIGRRVYFPLSFLHVKEGKGESCFNYPVFRTLAAFVGTVHLIRSTSTIPVDFKSPEFFEHCDCMLAKILGESSIVKKIGSGDYFLAAQKYYSRLPRLNPISCPCGGFLTKSPC